MSADSLERLQKFLAKAGVGSRRKAEALIEEGRVLVNGQVAKLGQKVDPSLDHVFLDNKRMRVPDAPKVILILHKPSGYTCTRSDRHARKTIFDLLPKNFRDDSSLHCAGRLDRDSQGLVVITNDGDLTFALTHPSQKVLKHYRVVVDKAFPFEMVGKMIQGVQDEGEHLKAEAVLPHPGKPRELEITLNHGKKREIRRLLKRLGFQVIELERFKIGKLGIQGLRPGSTKRLSEAEKRLLLS
ncbi:MAG: rRNA pseudouridine synthase [Verrucomicrobiae bacterium]|nr:rRNA pseudouridine synthase [Verrucomicrobiae bacterium]